MIRIIILITLAALTIPGCDSSDGNRMTAENKTDLLCSPECKAKNSSTNLSCKLTSAEMQKRKATVLGSLRKQILDKKEIANGYAFKFNGSDKMLDDLTAFIKSERECCDFFTFNLSIAGDKNEIWLELTGAKEAKAFIKTELEL